MSTIIFHWVLLRSRWNEHLPINSDLVKWFPGSHLSSNTVYPMMFCSQWLIPEWVIARCQSQSRRRAFNLEKYRVSLRTNERTDMPFGSWMNNNINQRQLYLSTWWFTWARRWIGLPNPSQCGHQSITNVTKDLEFVSYSDESALKLDFSSFITFYHPHTVYL